MTPVFLAFKPRPAWYDHANCRGMSVDLFYPDPGTPPHQAIAVCHTCPVQPQCALAGLGEEHGVWGGLSARARNRIRRSHAA